MLIKTFFSGFGGQGVLLMGYTLAYSAMLEGKHVTYLPAYGAEVRGGTAHCTVSISDDEEISSPVASSPEFLVVMNNPALEKFQNFIQSGGGMFINSTLVEKRPIRGDIEVFEVPATKIAEELSAPRAANMVMIGAFLKQSGLAKLSTVQNNYENIFGAKLKKAQKLNNTALEAGYHHFDSKK